MIQIVSFDGYVKDTDYVHFTIKGGSSDLCLGDIMWGSETELEILDYAADDEEDWECICKTLDENGGHGIIKPIKGYGMVKRECPSLIGVG